MKRLNKSLKSALISWSWLCLSSILIHGCADGPQPLGPLKTDAKVAFFNGAPIPAYIDLYVNDIDLIAHNNFDIFQYKAYVPHILLRSNEPHTFRFDEPGEPLVELTRTFEEFSYTIFLVNEKPFVETIVIQDRKFALENNMTSLRFINLSPDSPPLDIYLSNTKVVSSQPFKGFTDFSDRFATTYDIEVRAEGSEDTLISAENIIFSEGIHYSVVVTGYINPNDQELPFPLSLGVVADTTL